MISDDYVNNIIINFQYNDFKLCILNNLYYPQNLITGKHFCKVLLSTTIDEYYVLLYAINTFSYLSILLTEPNFKTLLEEFLKKFIDNIPENYDEWVKINDWDAQ